jgi:hypothetical protein
MSSSSPHNDSVESLRWPAADETYTVHMLIEQYPAVLTSLRPWFVTFNAYCGEPSDGYPGEYRFHFFEPFPVEEFPPIAPCMATRSCASTVSAGWLTKPVMPHPRNTSGT